MNIFFKYFLIFVVTVWSFSFVGLVLAVDQPVLQVDVGQSFSGVGDCGESCLSVAWIGEYVQAIYRYGVSLAVILAIIMIMIGGFIWILSGGSSDRVGTAKSFVASSLTGLALALFSFVILQTINPNLVNLQPLNITQPEELPLAPVITSNTFVSNHTAIPENSVIRSDVDAFSDDCEEVLTSRGYSQGDELRGIELDCYNLEVRRVQTQGNDYFYEIEANPALALTLQSRGSEISKDPPTYRYNNSTYIRVGAAGAEGTYWRVIHLPDPSIWESIFSF